MDQMGSNAGESLSQSQLTQSSSECVNLPIFMLLQPFSSEQLFVLAQNLTFV